MEKEMLRSKELQDLIQRQKEEERKRLALQQNDHTQKRLPSPSMKARCRSAKLTV